jgi:hypothetical protein
MQKKLGNRIREILPILRNPDEKGRSVNGVFIAKGKDQEPGHDAM